MANPQNSIQISMSNPDNTPTPERGRRTKPYTIASLTAFLEIIWSYALQDNIDALKVAIGITPFAVAILDFGFEKYLDFRQDNRYKKRREEKLKAIGILILEKAKQKENGTLNKVQRAQLDKEFNDLVKMREQTLLGEYDE